MKPATSFQLEYIVACQYCADQARQYEGNAIRHQQCAGSLPAPPVLGPRKTRAELNTQALKEAARYGRLTEAAQAMRAAAQEDNFRLIDDSRRTHSKSPDQAKEARELTRCSVLPKPS